MKRGVGADFSKKLEKLINPKKLKVMKIIGKEKKLNQTQLQKKLGFSYRQTKRYIDSLHHVGILKKKRVKKERGSPVFISLRK